MKHFAIPALALVLAACGGSNDDGPSSAEPVEAVSDTPIPVEPDGGIGDGAKPLDEVLANRIPTRFHGVWDYDKGTCAPESDLRMEISGSEILFYESIGMVTGVEEEGDAIIVALAMEGEGDTWEQKTRLMLTGEGERQRLETSDGDKPRVVDEYPSKRCPS